MARSANEENHRQSHWAQSAEIRDWVADCMRNREPAHALITPADAVRAFHTVQICTEARPAFGVQEMSRSGIPVA
jgi:hypothetical protein